ncbi:MAG: 3-oxoacid CoA-transferase [Lachnospiraceae bacterium]|nr:3-oxoacid CoA-transferase [Lachnospiraceae bacterium]
MSRFITAAEASELIKDEMTVAIGGFGAYGGPDGLMQALRDRFDETGSPRNITTVSGISPGDNTRNMVGMNRIAKEGLIKAAIAGHFGNPPLLSELAASNKIAAFPIPLGVVVHLFRAIAARQPGYITNVGLNTYADPRNEGCKINDKARESGREIVRLMEIDGKEYLFYHSFKIDACLIRGDMADEDGNICLKKDALHNNEAEIAEATHNCGGIVICQVEETVKNGTLLGRDVNIHNSIVDYVVKVPRELSRQGYAQEGYHPELSGETIIPTDEIEPMPLNVRKVIARRSAMELSQNCVINLGIGLPSGVGNVANEEGISSLLSMESGPLGGVPVEGVGFGAAINPEMIIPVSDVFDMYDGGYLDVTFLGGAEIDKKGNVNVSMFGPRCTGPGGFINITQNTPKIYFLATFTAGKTELEIADGELRIHKDGSIKKFVDKVQQITFSADYARKSGQEVGYITERAVFKLTETGIMLTEIAPGVDLEKDILDKMDFVPEIAEDLAIMDPRLFKPEVMGIASEIS